MSYINVTFMFAKRTHINTEAKRENWQLSSTGAILAFIILVQQDGKKKKRETLKENVWINIISTWFQEISWINRKRKHCLFVFSAIFKMKAVNFVIRIGEFNVLKNEIGLTWKRSVCERQMEVERSDTIICSKYKRLFNSVSLQNKQNVIRAHQKRWSIWLISF